MLLETTSLQGFILRGWKEQSTDAGHAEFWDRMLPTEVNNLTFLTKLKHYLGFSTVLHVCTDEVRSVMWTVCEYPTQGKWGSL